MQKRCGKSKLPVRPAQRHKSNFITAQSRQVMLYGQQIREYERRHEVSSRAWSELEQEKREFGRVDFLRKEALEEQAASARYVECEDKRLVYLEDKLATLAGYGSKKSSRSSVGQRITRHETRDCRFLGPSAEARGQTRGFPVEKEA